MTPTLEADPDCARPIERDAGVTDNSDTTAATRSGQSAPNRALRAERRAFGDIDRSTWDRLAALNPQASPFSSWAFHRAWWDAYGANAHDQTVVVVDPAAPDPTQPVAIVPLMHRHVVEASDAATHTMIRHADGPALTPLAPTACVVYFGASYHADYATILAAPADLQAVADAVVDAFATDAIGPEHDDPWSAIDLRRLRAADPATEAFAAAFGAREMSNGWTLNVEREDVCPVITLPKGADLDGFLSTLGKKERHEIRRKVRRAEAAGDVLLIDSADRLADLDAFIDLHQARWGADGLFPPTPGGDQSRHFFRRLFELADESLHLAFLTVNGERIAAAVFFETQDSILYYNAGVSPEARELSPGVVLLERLVRRAIDDGRCRVDLMRGDEPYKYEWGGVDEPVQRILVRRTAATAGGAA
ncbi:MAG TPA: GNAT family N-acetyltransferase [Candidatus Limnocylindrales bacterium]|nr:GNAT family N-acetyltransferase [Candidatus Limnocylindrales bacterium]